MGKLSDNELHTQTLREQGLGVIAIISSYPDKWWTLSTVKNVCSRVDHTGSAVLCKPCCERPATAFSFYGWILKNCHGENDR